MSEWTSAADWLANQSQANEVLENFNEEVFFPAPRAEATRLLSEPSSAPSYERQFDRLLAEEARRCVEQVMSSPRILDKMCTDYVRGVARKRAMELYALGLQMSRRENGPDTTVVELLTPLVGFFSVFVRLSDGFSSDMYICEDECFRGKAIDWISFVLKDGFNLPGELAARVQNAVSSLRYPTDNFSDHACCIAVLWNNHRQLSSPQLSLDDRFQDLDIALMRKVGWPRAHQRAQPVKKRVREILKGCSLVVRDSLVGVALKHRHCGVTEPYEILDQHRIRITQMESAVKGLGFDFAMEFACGKRVHPALSNNWECLQIVSKRAEKSS